LKIWIPDALHNFISIFVENCFSMQFLVTEIPNKGLTLVSKHSAISLLNSLIEIALSDCHNSVFKRVKVWRMSSCCRIDFKINNSCKTSKDWGNTLVSWI
jgi:hypothetical protein